MCPISHDLMEDPVTTHRCSSLSFESALQKYVHIHSYQQSAEADTHVDDKCNERCMLMMHVVYIDAGGLILSGMP